MIPLTPHGLMNAINHYAFGFMERDDLARNEYRRRNDEGAGQSDFFQEQTPIILNLLEIDLRIGGNGQMQITFVPKWMQFAIQVGYCALYSAIIYVTIYACLFFIS